MATITIRNVPEAVYDRLKERAAKAGRSLNAELIRILIMELSRKPRDMESILEDLTAFQATLSKREPASMDELRSWIREERE